MRQIKEDFRKLHVMQKQYGRLPQSHIAYKPVMNLTQVDPQSVHSLMSGVGGVQRIVGGVPHVSYSTSLTCARGVCVCVCVCVTSSRWRQEDHVVAEGDHSNTMFARRWYVLLCWMEFPTTGSVSVAGLHQLRVPLHSSSGRPTKLQRANRVFFDPPAAPTVHHTPWACWLG